MLTLHQIGCGYRHPAGFEIFRPEGSGNWLFLILKSQTRLFLSGREFVTEPGAVILYPPGLTQHYRALSDRWENDFLHFSGEEAAFLAGTLRLPLGQVRYPADLSEMMRLLREVEEASVRTPELADLVADASIRSLFLRLHRMESLPAGRNAEPLRQLRLTLYRTLAEPWSVERMAAQVHLSPSHFYAEYRRLFGVSPAADLIGMRISLAKYYLENTALPLASIAPLAGFSNEYHFIRQFKQHTGQTPARYRRGK